MNTMNKQQVEMAVGSGLELLGEKSEIVIPVKLNDGVFLLKQLLMSIANGTIGLTPTTQQDTPPGDPPPPPPGSRTGRRVAKKKAKKKASKKK